MAKEAKKPEGWQAFDELARKLVRVPKEAVDKRVQQKKRPKKRK